MSLKARFWLLSLALIGAVILSACSSGSSSNIPTGAPIVTMQDTLKFEPTSIIVKSGGNVDVKNNGAQQHNFVVVKPEDAERVSQEALAKGGDATGIAGVLAGGKLVAPGGNETVAITAPAGSYVYMCTVAGHYQAGMKGTITVQ